MTRMTPPPPPALRPVRSIPTTSEASKGHFLRRWRVTQVNDRYVSSCGAHARMCSVQPEQLTKWGGSVTVSFIRLLRDDGRLPEANLSTHGRALQPLLPPPLRASRGSDINKKSQLSALFTWLSVSHLPGVKSVMACVRGRKLEPWKIWGV